MRVSIISTSLIIRKGIREIISKEGYITSIKESNVYSSISELEDDLLIVDINKYSKEYLYDIENFKSNSKKRVMMIDFNEEKSLFKKCLKLGIDSYLLGNLDSENICYAIRQLYLGKKYYNSDLMDKYLFKEEDELTNREKEVFDCIVKGKTNIEISRELYISEHTVKKHVSNIFEKLYLKDRTQAIVYAYKRGIV